MKQHEKNMTNKCLQNYYIILFSRQECLIILDTDKSGGILRVINVQDQL